MNGYMDSFLGLHVLFRALFMLLNKNYSSVHPPLIHVYAFTFLLFLKHSCSFVTPDCDNLADKNRMVYWCVFVVIKLELRLHSH